MKNYGYVTRSKTSVPAGVNTTIVSETTAAPQRDRAGIRLMRLPDGTLTTDLQGYYDYDRQQASSYAHNE